MNDERSPESDSIVGGTQQELHSDRTAGPDPNVHTGGATVTRRVMRDLVSWAGTMMSAGIYATVIITFVFQVARVEGHSMAPTLSDKDRLVINKLDLS